MWISNTDIGKNSEEKDSIAGANNFNVWGKVIKIMVADYRKQKWIYNLIYTLNA